MRYPALLSAVSALLENDNNGTIMQSHYSNTPYAASGGASGVGGGGALTKNGSNGRGDYAEHHIPPPLSIPLQTKVRSAIETLILRGRDFRAEFDRYSENADGTVGREDFRLVLTDLRLTGECLCVCMCVRVCE